MAAWDKLLMAIANLVVDAMPRMIQKLCDKEGELIGY
jgi:hypothetical protein